MPQIPVLETPTVKPGALQPNYQSSATPEGAFGEGYARAGQQVAASLAGHAEAMARQRQAADITRVNAEAAEYNKQASLITDEAYKKQGKDAIGVTDATVAQLEGLAKEKAKGLANDDQRNKLVPQLMNSITQDRTALSRHESKESDVFAFQSAQALAASAIDRAAKNWTQTEPGGIVEGALKQNEDAIRSQAKIRGWSEEATNQAVADGKSGVFAAMMRTQDAQAAHAAFIKTFEAHQGELNAKDLDTFSKIYRETTDTARAFQASDDIYKKHTTLDVHGRLVTQNMSAMYTEANAAPSDIRKDVVANVELRIRETQKAEEDYVVNFTRTAWDAFEANGGKVESLPMSIREGMSRINGPVLEQMRTAERQRVSGGPEPFDFGSYGRYEEQAPADRLKPGNTAIERGLGRWPRSVVKEKTDEETLIRDQQQGLRPSGAEIHGPSLDRLGIVGVTAQAIQENAELFDPRGPERADRVASDTLKGKFSRYVRQRADAFQQKEHRNPSYDEMRKIIDDALIDGQRTTPHWYWDTTEDVKRFEAKPGDVFPEPPQSVASTAATPAASAPTAPAAIPDTLEGIPPDALAAAVEKLRKNGYPANNGNVWKQYRHDFPEAQP